MRLLPEPLTFAPDEETRMTRPLPLQHHRTFPAGVNLHE